MRTEQEMLDLILDAARNDDRIRAVVMNGSRANPDAARDIFQDYDIVYLVTDVDSFSADHTWIDRFGERMILQMPETMADPPARGDGRFIYLMQFADGNRIDLTLLPAARALLPASDHGALEWESLSRLLLDKDGIVEPFPPPTDTDYLPSLPTAKGFADCCNEFWWVCPYVAKGLWRRELPYAKFMLDQAVRPQLMKMLTWYVGVRSGFTRGPGKCGKHLEQCLPPKLWAALESTYAGPGYDVTWDALTAMGHLFRDTATEVAKFFSFDYPAADDGKVSAHLEHVRHLPGDAQEVY